MATFLYEAMNNVGQPVKGEVDASSSEDAIAKVRAMGNFPTKIKERASKRASKAAAPGAPAAASGGTQAKRRSVGKVSGKLMTQFTRQLSTLVDAGLPILRSLRILENQCRPGRLQNALMDTCDEIEAGSTLSDCWAEDPPKYKCAEICRSPLAR